MRHAWRRLDNNNNGARRSGGARRRLDAQVRARAAAPDSAAGCQPALELSLARPLSSCRPGGTSLRVGQNRRRRRRDSPRREEHLAGRRLSSAPPPTSSKPAPQPQPLPLQPARAVEKVEFTARPSLGPKPARARELNFSIRRGSRRRAVAAPAGSARRELSAPRAKPAGRLAECRLVGQVCSPQQQQQQHSGALAGG